MSTLDNPAPFAIGESVVSAFEPARKGIVVAVTWESAERGRGRTWDWQVAIPGYCAPAWCFKKVQQGAE